MTSTSRTARSSAQSLEQFQTEAREAMQRIQKDRVRSHSSHNTPDQIEEQVQALYNHVEEITILFADYVQWASQHQQELASSSQTRSS